MQKLPGLKNYFYIVKNIISTTILSDRNVMAVSMLSMAINIVAEYYVVESVSASSKLKESFKTEAFRESLKDVLLLGLFTTTLKFIPSMIFTYMLQSIQREKFVHYLREVLNLSFEDFHARTPGELQYAVFIKSYAAPMCCQILIIDVSSIVGNIIFSVYNTKARINFKVASIFIFVPIFYIVAVLTYIKFKIKYHYNLLSSQQHTAMKLSDKLLNYEAIKTYNLEEREAADFYNIIGVQTQTNMTMGKYEAFSRYLLTFTINIPFMVTMSIFSFYPGYFKSDLLQVVILYFYQASDLKRLGNEMDSLIEYLNQIDFTAVDRQSFAAAPGSTDLGSRSVSPGSSGPVAFEHSIEFEHFSVFHKDNLIVEDICETIYKNEKIAVVGKNGTGKSSFIKSIMGFTNSSGVLKIDGVDRANLSERGILDIISYVPQEDFTSDDTVMNNILLGEFRARHAVEDGHSMSSEIETSNLASHDDESFESGSEQVHLRKRVIDLAKQFGAHETFVGLEKGYDTQVGPRGNKLSGGQKQKISLIRATLKDSSIFVLDEATASMDKKFERELLENLFKHLKNKTIIMIVHGVEYLPLFDRIFFLNDRKVEQTGTYQELLETNDNFRKFIQ